MRGDFIGQTAPHPLRFVGIWFVKFAAVLAVWGPIIVLAIAFTHK